MILFGTYNLGYNKGKFNVQAKWDSAELKRKNAETLVMKDNSVKETQHGTKGQEISNDLTELEKIHERTIAVITSDHDKRLRISEQRAKVFESMSKASAFEQASLASHAAQLDRSLEEGRQLVGEFGQTLKLRDGQIRLLGAQIQSDRKLIGSGITDGNTENATEAVGNGPTVNQP